MPFQHCPLRDAIAAAGLLQLVAPSGFGSVEAFRPVDVLGLAQAFALAGRLDGGLFAEIGAALQRYASAQVSGHTTRALWQENLASKLEEAPWQEPCILVEQPQIVVLWKPPGWSVAVSCSEDDLETADDQGPMELQQSGPTPRGKSLHRAPRLGEGGQLLQDWLRETFDAHQSITSDAAAAHGLVHRLDRETSGPLLCAKNYYGYYAARLQFAALRVQKEYVCLCHGWVPKGSRLLDSPLRTLRIDGDSALQSVLARGGRRALTELLAVGHLWGPGGQERFSAVEVRLHTGRLHQIRVHLANDGTGYPLVGDSSYGADRPRPLWCSRLFLHSRRLSADVGDGLFDIRSPLPQDLRLQLGVLLAADEPSAAMMKMWLQE